MEQALTLSQLNTEVRQVIKNQFPDTYWLRAETSDVRENRNGNCYLEFVEKDANGGNIIARARGIIWARTFQMLKAYFEVETGRAFVSGLNVLVRVSVDFHELYGYTLTVVDIDPTFTVGDIARARALTLKRLEEEGVLSLNKELVLPELVQRIAVISSPTAAGYEDFCNQLQNNKFGFAFYTKLFPAIMQGEQSEASIVQALEKIYAHTEHFDVVAIMRGGGSSSDLSCFDSYMLAYHCTQFPLPIISGVGHERDVTVLDAVAHTRAKTPTAVAEFLIAHLAESYDELFMLQNDLVTQIRTRVREEQNALFAFSKDMFYHSSAMLKHHASQLALSARQLKIGTAQTVKNQQYILEKQAQFIAMSAPENILKRGYTLTLHNGKIVKSADALAQKAVIETRFADGSIQSEVL